MKYIKKLAVAAVCLLAVFCTGCGGFASGTRPEVLVDGAGIEVGKTTSADLMEQGFLIDEHGFAYDTMPDRAWTSIYFGKERNYGEENDEETEIDVFYGVTHYGRLSIVNAGSSSKASKDCKIEEVFFSGLNMEYVDWSISVNGVELAGLTEESLLKAFPELEEDTEESGDGVTVYHLTDGDYTIVFRCSDDMLTDAEVKHTFDKSYLPR